MFKSKLFYVMAIAYTTILAALFGVAFPSVPLQSVATVLMVVGLLLATISYYLIKWVGSLKKEGK